MLCIDNMIEAHHRTGLIENEATPCTLLVGEFL